MGLFFDAVQNRRSIRSFEPDELDAGIMADIEKALNAQRKGPFGSEVRFRLIHSDREDRMKSRQLGTYGMISGAPAFIAGAVADTSTCMEDYGYCLEKIILSMTHIGLGTCWLGGTLNRSGFTEQIDLQDGELMPAVTPVGLPKGKQGIKSKLVRLAIGSEKKKQWEELFFIETPDNPLAKADAEKTGIGPYADSLESVRLSPSASNKQPCRMIIVKEKLYHFYLSPTPGYGTYGNKISLQRIDIGIAMCHFEVTARENGLAGVWKIDNPDIPDAEKAGFHYIATWECV